MESATAELPSELIYTNSLFGYFFQDFRYFAKFQSALVSSAPGAAAATAIKETWPCDDMEILASCDQGILCCQRRICYNKRFYVCKPATSQWQALPNPKLRYETDAVAIVVVRSTPLRYIIARLYCSGTMQHHCEIFDSETWAWEKIECAAPYGEIIEYCRPAVTTAGRFFHWLTVNGNVLTLDVKRRSFRCSPLPCDPACKSKELVEYEGGLGFMCVVEEGDRREMEVWAGAERKVVVDMRGIERALKHAQPVELCSSTVVFLRWADGGAFYNVENGSFSSVEVPYELRNPKQVFRFRSDWEIVDLKGGRRRRRTLEPNSPTADNIISSEPNSSIADKIISSGHGLVRVTLLAMFFLFVGKKNS